jgi:hypothetical protein
MYNIVIDFWITMKQARLIIIYLNITYSRIRISKYLSEIFRIQYGLNQSDALSPLLFKFTLKCTLGRSKKTI